LYITPNNPVSPGTYQLHASLKNNGNEVASSTMNIGVR
jgi:hypothetical protein